MKNIQQGEVNDSCLYSLIYFRKTLKSLIPKRGTKRWYIIEKEKIKILIWGAPADKQTLNINFFLKKIFLRINL